MKQVSEEVFNALFPDDDSQQSLEESFRASTLQHRTKIVQSGSYLESITYPVRKIPTSSHCRKNEQRKNADAQKAFNDRNAKRHLIRLLNANFTERSAFVTLTYEKEPESDENAKIDIRNTLRKLNYWKHQHGLPPAKYIHVMEDKTSNPRKRRTHFHMVIDFTNREVLDRLWKHGYLRAKPLTPDENGFARVAEYLLKDPKQKRKWCSSKNLAKPIVTTFDRVITTAKAELLNQSLETNASAVFTRKHPQYDVVECHVKTLPYVSGIYAYTVMQKTKRPSPNSRSVLPPLPRRQTSPSLLPLLTRGKPAEAMMPFLMRGRPC